jgi:preprotein translocase subunit SecG
MSVLEIIGALLLIIASVFIIIIVLMQESKRGMSQTLTGAATDNYYQKNSSRTKEARLKKATKFAAVLFFAVAVLVNVFIVYLPAASDEEVTSDGAEVIGSLTVDIGDALEETAEPETVDETTTTAAAE